MSVIVIGGGAGGMEATCRLVRALPREIEAWVAIALSAGDQELRHVARHTSLPVLCAEPGQTPAAGHIYLAPVDRHLVMRPPGLLDINDGPKVRDVRPSANLLFESAAAVFERRVIGVVLSGGDGDGTHGLAAIKAQGGVSIVQSPADAREPGMPVNALIHGNPDHTVLLDELGELIVRLVRERRQLLSST